MGLLGISFLNIYFFFKWYYVVCKIEECYFSREFNCFVMDRVVKYGLDDSIVGFVI